MTLLTAEQVCDKLQVKKSYLYHLTHTNKIPFIKLGNHLRFDTEDIDNWLLKLKNGGEADEYI